VEFFAGVGSVAGAESVAGSPGDPGRSALTAEGVVGATFGVIHARLLHAAPAPLTGLLKPLMTMIVLPYRGSAAAARELELPAPEIPVEVRRRKGGLLGAPLGSASPVDYRLTVRTQMALAAVAERPGLNNREVSEIIGLADQGQISRMMKRLAEHGLVENTQSNTRRLARAWQLTPQGEAVIDAHRDGRSLIKAQPGGRKGGKLVAKRGRRGKNLSQAGPAASPPSRLRDSILRDSISFATGQPTDLPGRGTSSPGRPGRSSGSRAAFRLTALTHEVLAAVANLSGGDSNPSNRDVARAAGVKDEGQISKLLARLERHGMLENTGGHPAAGNAWRLTPRGDEILSASRPTPRGARK
jgi:DNA-binding MarR family transcriptional regulator